MSGNSQARKWCFVINNPHTYGFTHEVLIEILMLFFPEYFCLADEISSTGTLHTHGFIYSFSPIRFSTLQKRLKIAHIEKAYGSVKENREYILKQGKWTETDKVNTKIEGSFYEYGNIPDETEEKNPVQSALIKDLYDGKRTAEIIENNPALVFKVKDIEILRQTLLAEKYSTEFRQLDVTYLFGVSSSGKTKHIYDSHPANEICRITNYRNGKGILFDNYAMHDILVFEAFSSQVPIYDMLNYLDIYPLMLSARYNDKVACYTKVYITSDMPLEMQYIDIQRTKPEIWKSLLRRIHHILKFENSNIKIIK